MFKVSFWGGKITSDEGFTVTLAGRFSVKYEEELRNVTIACESDGNIIELFHSSIKTLTSNGQMESIDNPTEKRIVDNLFRALEARGFYVRMVT